MRRIVASAFVILLSCQSAKTKEGATPLVRKSNYWSSAADESLPLDLTLSRDGSAELWLRCNRDAPKRQSLGRFRHAFPASEAEPVFGRIESGEFAAVANPAGVVPGEVMRKITLETSDGKETFRFVGESEPPAPAFSQAEGAFLALADKMIDHPDAALSFRLDRALPEAVHRDREETLVLTLANAGRVPLRLDLPEGWRASGTEMMLTGLRTDIPLDKMTNDHSRRIVPGPGRIKTDPPVPEGEKTIILAPGKSISFSLPMVFDWPPGPYEAKLSYAFGMAEVPSSGTESDLGRFEWISPGMRLRVPGE